MSTLSQSSSHAVVIAAYEDNASYAEDGSVAKAKAFVTACRFLLLRPSKIQVGSELMEFDHLRMEKMIAEAERWIAVNGAAGVVKHVDMTNFRD